MNKRGRRHHAAPSTSPSRPPEGVREIAAALADRKAVDPVVLDLHGLSEATDYFVIASGTSDAHVRGMAEHLMRRVAPHHVEGLPQGRWVLLDYVDVVVHIFHPEQREFYQLERLWADAPAIPIEEG